jgi:hypothetical protein
MDPEKIFLMKNADPDPDPAAGKFVLRTKSQGYFFKK